MRKIHVLIERRRLGLQAQATHLGAYIDAEKPKALVARWAAWYEQAQQSAPLAARLVD